MRKQNHIANVGAIGDQHHQTVDTNAATTGGRHAVFKCTNEVGVKENGLVVARFFGFNLLFEPVGLVFWIVQLRKTVGNFTASDEQFKPFSNL